MRTVTRNFSEAVGATPALSDPQSSVKSVASEEFDFNRARELGSKVIGLVFASIADTLGAAAIGDATEGGSQKSASVLDAVPQLSTFREILERIRSLRLPRLPPAG